MSSISGIMDNELTENELQELLREFPNVACFCDICSCGQCWRHKHSHTCKKYRVKASFRQKEFPETVYTSTYKEKLGRPRSSKRPPMTPRNPYPLPMFLDSTQRAEYKEPGINAPTQSCKATEHYIAPTEPLECSTSYRTDFPRKTLEGRLTMRADERENARRDPGKFVDNTTNKDHYRPWQRIASVPFRELPSFTGSILYPNRAEKYPETTTQSVFKGKFGQRPTACERNNGTLAMEGQVDHTTTHRSTYTPKRAERTQTSRPAEKFVARTGKFKGTTQTMADYVPHINVSPAAMIPPVPETINLKFNDRMDFKTEQRDCYAGVDVSSHPPPKSEKATESYTVPTQPFETETSQRNDYKAYDISAFAPVRAKERAVQRLVQPGKFDGRTTNNEFFKSWKVNPRVHYGDFHERQKYGFTAPMEKFDGVSTTKSTYQAKPIDRVKPFIPPNSKIDMSGKQEFTTVYKDEFVDNRLPICPAKLYIIKKEMLKRRLLDRKKAATFNKLTEGAPISVR